MGEVQVHNIHTALVPCALQVAAFAVAHCAACCIALSCLLTVVNPTEHAAHRHSDSRCTLARMISGTPLRPAGNVGREGGIELQTAPVNTVLEGITRVRVLDACRRLDISVNETCPHPHQRESWREAFLCNCLRAAQPLQSITCREGALRLSTAHCGPVYAEAETLVAVTCAVHGACARCSLQISRALSSPELQFCCS